MRNPTPKSRTSLSLRFLAWTTVLLICLCGPGCRNEKAPPAESSGDKKLTKIINKYLKEQ